nr:SDR family oxidoreductase [Pseudomonadota bacterium]
SVFLLSQAMIRAMMKKRWGRIIIISSVVASTGNAGQANYCAAKAGLEGYCRALAREVASRNITVNAVAPGFIQTDMTEQLPAAIKEHLIANTPLGRMGSPQDVAAAVLYLASAGADYVTGQVLHVNGGMYMG